MRRTIFISDVRQINFHLQFYSRCGFEHIKIRPRSFSVFFSQIYILLVGSSHHNVT